ncbi:MAG: tetratricopeptide repeat protein [Spirochaetia bacterium]|jgi:Flp pilus assembly protein TadD
MMRASDYSAMLEQALEAGRNRDYTRAVELLTRIVGSTDRYPQALLYLGRGYHALGDYARAAQMLHFYVRQKPDSVPGHFFLGRAYIGLGEYGQAIQHLKRAVQRDPLFSPAHGLLGLACLKARRPDKAIWWFAKALEIDPQNKRLQVGYLNTALVLAIRLFYRGDLADAARLFNEVLEQRRASILPHLYLSSIYREQGKHSLALYHMDAASAISPQDPFLPLQKAVILLAQGDKAAAAAEIRNGTRLLHSSVSPGGSPEDLLRFITINLFREKRYRETVFYGAKLLRESYDDPQMHALVAEAYGNLGDLLKAKNHYLRAIEKDRASLELRYGLMSVLWKRREFEELLLETARVVQKDRSNGPGRYFHSLALSRTGAAIEQVLAELQQQIKEHGPDPVLMAELGAAYARAGLPELAEGWYVRSMKLSPASPETLLTLADVYEALGKRELLGGVFRQYLDANSEDRAVRRRFVRILLEQEAFSDAAEQIALLLPLEPDNSRLKATLAICYRRTARYGEALVLLRDLLAESPDAEELIKAAVYCLDRMGNRLVGMRALESFMKQHGETLSLVLMLGVLQFQENSLEKSAETFRKAVSLSPADWRANRNLGMVYRKMGNEDYAEKFLAKAAQCLAAAKASGAQ